MNKEEFSNFENQLVTSFDIGRDLPFVFDKENYDEAVKQFFNIFDVHKNSMLQCSKNGFANYSFQFETKIEYYNSFGKHHLNKIQKEYFDNYLKMKFDYDRDIVTIKLDWFIRY